MQTKGRKASLAALLSLTGLMVVTSGSRILHSAAEHVRWDIINLTAGPTVNAGGVAYASARTGGSPSGLKIKLTGSGTFVAPASGGESSAVTGGGTWETFSGCPSACVSTSGGSYSVTRLASWEFANLQTPGLTDTIGPDGANGTAVFRIVYSDGSEGTLGVGCHGPGAPSGILEGVIATKDFATYWDAEAPAGIGPGNKNRTSFHLE